MLSAEKIDEIARAVAVKNLPRESVDRVVSAAAMDSEGHEAVRILIRLKSNTLARVGGDAVLDTLVGIQTQLSAAGEDRLPLVEYASADEIEPDGDA